MSIPLNPAQRKAVEHPCGPLLVLAGAGSGKTRVITQRIARLVLAGVPARSIVALTFTNKAAGEMRERVDAILDSSNARALAKDLTVCTFHAFGLNVLRHERTETGGAFTIFDQGDALAAVKEALRTMRGTRKVDAFAVLTRISLWKNAFLTADELPEDDEYDEIAKEVFPKYQAMLRSFRAYDFDDLVCEVVRLFRDKEHLRDRWQDRFQHVLVDEYQDTNRAQLELLLTLASKHKNVCVVGDDDQAIYGWRGADVRNILEFEQHFPGAKIVKLEQNYRSTKPILDVANAVIARRTDVRHRKTLVAHREGGEKVQLRVAESPDIEADWVAGEIRRLIKDEHERPRDIAVLYRSNSQACAIEQSLREQGIAHRTVGGQQFFERKEVKDVLAYLRLAIEPRDEISLRRIINYPPRGIGDASIERLEQHAKGKAMPLWRAVEHAKSLGDLPPVARQGCNDLLAIVAAIRKTIVDDKRPVWEAASDLVSRIGLRSDLEASSGSPQAAARRWRNVEGLVATLKRREEKAPMDANELRQFLQALTLGSRPEEGEEASDVVTLSTLHGAKGLEFDIVFLIGCEEGYIPHARTIDARTTDVEPTDAPDAGAQSIEEERRLFYVGITRARKRLVLLRCKTRAMRGKARPRAPSRFLADIPKELLDEKEIERPAGMTQEAMTAQANALLAALEGLR